VKLLRRRPVTDTGIWVTPCPAVAVLRGTVRAVRMTIVGGWPELPCGRSPGQDAGVGYRPPATCPPDYAPTHLTDIPSAAKSSTCEREHKQLGGATKALYRVGEQAMINGLTIGAPRPTYPGQLAWRSSGSRPAKLASRPASSTQSAWS